MTKLGDSFKHCFNIFQKGSLFEGSRQGREPCGGGVGGGVGGGGGRGGGSGGGGGVGRGVGRGGGRDGGVLYSLFTDLLNDHNKI